MLAIPRSCVTATLLLACAAWALLAPRPARADAPAPAPGLTSFAGYAEGTWQAFAGTREDGTAAPPAPRAAFARAALEARHAFTARLALRARFTWNDAGDAGGNDRSARGGGALECAALTWSRSSALSVQLGELLVPSGVLNLAHAPGEHLGALRSDLEQRVLPVPWNAPGIAASGELPHGLAWTLAVQQGLDARGFAAGTAIRGGRKPSPARDLRPMLTARLDATLAQGVALGGSVVTGDAWPRAQPDSFALHPRVWVNEAHVSLRRGALELRALYVMSLLWDHAALSRELGVAHSDSALGKHSFGGAIEGAYDVGTRLGAHGAWSLSPYARFELTDTQDGVGTIGSEDPQWHQTVLTTGLAFAPLARLVLKADHQHRHHEDGSGVSQWNVAVGYGF